MLVNKLLYERYNEDCSACESNKVLNVITNSLKISVMEHSALYTLIKAEEGENGRNQSKGRKGLGGGRREWSEGRWKTGGN